MEYVVRQVSFLTPGDWIAIFFGITGTLISLGALWYTRREHRLKIQDEVQTIKATINKDVYRDGWRSVQLHVIPTFGDPRHFGYGDWKIERMRLLRPWTAKLARAQDDDYATGVFFPENPIRTLEGKSEQSLQRFALEFFIKFRGDDDRGSRAKFEVTFSRLDGAKRRTIRTWVAVPKDAVQRRTSTE